MVLFKSFMGSVRHTAVVDIVKMSMVAFAGTTVFGLANVFFYQSGGVLLVPFSVLIMDLCLNILALTSSRIVVKYIWGYRAQLSAKPQNKTAALNNFKIESCNLLVTHVARHSQTLEDSTRKCA